MNRVIDRDFLMREHARGGVLRFSAREGDRIGELTLLRVAGRRRGDGSILWECWCDCGGVAIRATGALAKAVRDGGTPCCRECYREARRGQRAIAEDGKAQFWTAMFRRYGNVWPLVSQERMSDRIASDLEEWGHRAPRDVPLPEAAYQAEFYESRWKRQQQAAYLYPINGRGKAEWLCVDCKKFFARGFGCVQCIEPTCVECVRSELHICAYDDGSLTLHEIGRHVASYALVAGEDAQGLSRERVRGIQKQALRKLRHPKVLKEIAA